MVSKTVVSDIKTKSCCQKYPLTCGIEETKGDLMEHIKTAEQVNLE
jgi:hypothetical protein